MRDAQANVQKAEMQNLVDFLFASHRWLSGRTCAFCPPVAEVWWFIRTWPENFYGRREIETYRSVARDCCVQYCLNFIAWQARSLLQAVRDGLKPDRWGHLNMVNEETIWINFTLHEFMCGMYSTYIHHVIQYKQAWCWSILHSAYMGGQNRA